MRLSPTLAPRFSSIYRFKPLDAGTNQVIDQLVATHPEQVNQMLVNLMIGAERRKSSNTVVQSPLVMRLPATEKSPTQWFGFTNENTTDVLSFLKAPLPENTQQYSSGDVWQQIADYLQKNYEAIEPLTVALEISRTKPEASNKTLH